MLSANSAQQKLIVKSLTNEQYDVKSEIALNIYTGRYHLTKKYINQLELYQLYIRSLGSREVGTKQKPWILLKHLTIICNIMILKPIVHHLEKKNRMAREMILVPKLKYEHLKTIANNKEPVKPDSVNDNKLLKKMNDKALDNTAKSELIKDTQQT